MSDPKKHDPIQGEIVHEYDGILEADNRLPRWWVYSFVGTVLFGIFYWYYYQVFAVAQTPREAYLAERAQAQQQAAHAAVSSEALMEAAHDTALVDEGRAAFATSCVACHGAQGQGQIGPNLTDNAWIHGGTPEQIFAIVADGVLAKGMPAWRAPLGEQKVKALTAYLMSIRNTNVAGKEPQGEPFTP